MDKFTRQRFLNAMIFFAQNTRACGKIKLFKLLYLLDFEHFRQTGKSVTGFEYQAWKFGPVPVALMEEWEQPKQDFSESLRIVGVQVIDYIRYEISVREGVEFQDEDFTPRQLSIMAELCERFGGALSEQMIDVTHEQNQAWDRVWQGGEGARQTIPYEYALDDHVEGRAALIEIGRDQRLRSDAVDGLRAHYLH